MLWASIKTHIHIIVRMVVSLSNEVAMILWCPGGRARVVSWEHQVERACRHLAYCTRCIVVLVAFH